MGATAQRWLDPKTPLLVAWGAFVGAAAFAPTGWWPLAFVALVPLWTLALKEQPTRGAWCGFSYGVGFFGASLYFLIETLRVHGYMPLPLAASTYLLLVFYLALYPMLSTALIGYVAKVSPALALFVAPFAWTGFEWLRGEVIIGFPWGDLPMALWRLRPALALAPIVGVGGVRLLMASICVAGVYLSLPPKKRSETRQVLALPLIALALFFVLPTLIDSNSKVLGEGSAAIIQGNIPQSEKWLPGMRQETLKRYRELSVEAAISMPPDFLLWPETAMPSNIPTGSKGRRFVEGLARATRSAIVFGAPANVYKDGGIKESRNSVYSVTKEGEFLSRFDKVRLVPFGEYVPFERYLPFVKKMSSAAGNFRPGEGFFSLPLADARGGWRVGPLICFESLFPAFSTEQARGGANILTVVTNDSWFGDSSAPSRHLAYSAWRAAENGLWLLRAANTGISAIFNERGELLEATSLNETTFLRGAVEYRASDGLLQGTLRPWLELASLLLAILALFGILRLRRAGRGG